MPIPPSLSILFIFFLFFKIPKHSLLLQLLSISLHTCPLSSLMDEETRAKYAQNGEVMLASAILLFFLVLIIIFLHTYGHLCLCHRRRHLRRNTGHFYPHLIIPTSSSIRTTTTTTATSNKALELSILNLLPTFTYTSATHRPLQECAVCLSEFEDDDEGRVLPNCNHAFHCHCIDTWFRSHSNCPLCRAPVRPPKIEPVESVSSSDIEPTLSLSVIGSHSESQAGCSTLPPPIGCPRKPLELVGMVGVIVELPSVRRR